VRFLTRAAFVVAALSIAGCQRSTPLAPDQKNPTPAVTQSTESSAAASGKPEIDPTYANGKTVYMIGPRLIVDARTNQPNLYAKAEELYLVVYPQASTPQPGAGPITLPSGYQPQCDPCFHPGLPFNFVYHDHVITGAPGMGKDGTAGEFEAPWKVIVLVYNPAYVSSPNFKPVTSEDALDAAEQAGNVFLPINAGGSNPYEVETGNVLICPITSKHA
jgi:hypothetical protein